MKRIMAEKKTTLRSLGIQDWRKVMFETEKVNDLWRNIPTNNNTELNDWIYPGAKLVCEKIGTPLKSTDKKSKPGWEIRLESQIKELYDKQKYRQKQNMKIYSDAAEKARQLKRKVQLEETNKKELAKERRLKRYRDRTKQYRQTGLSKTTKENSTNK